MAEETVVVDGTSDFSGGMNSALAPNSLKNNESALAINVSFQRTTVTPRWGHEQVITLDWTLTGDYTRTSGVKVSFEEVFLSGKFQAFIPYSIGPDYFLIYVVSGFIFLINQATWEVTVLNPTDPLNVDADRVNWSNAGEFLVFFDFPNRPFILEGITLHRSDPAADEVPVSVLGTYNQNRLAIANAGIDWTAGDPAGSTATPDAPVTFIEVLAPSSPYVGDVYQVPTANKNNDFITAMGFLQVQDTSTGIGPLLVATRNAIYSYRTDLPRANWQGGAGGFVFGSVLLFSDGIVGQRAHVNVGSDLIFKSSDGQVRALSMARNEQRLWGNSPVSREVNTLLVPFDPSLEYVAVCTHYLNKIFATCNPYRVDCYSAEGVLQTDYVNGGVVVIELDNTANLTNQSPPIWAGLWTGARYMDFAANGGQFFSAAKFRNRNALFILDPEKTYDVVEGKRRDIRSVLVTKEFFNPDLTVNKKIHSLDLGLRNMEGKVNLKVEYNQTTTETFVPWRDIDFESPTEQCEAIPQFPNGLQSQGVLNLNLGGVTDEVCNIAEGYPMYIYKGVQLRIILTGKNWELDYVKFKGVRVPQTEVDPYCKEPTAVPVPAQCFDIWEIPETDNCEG